jgi:hypothetical protein
MLSAEPRVEKDASASSCGQRARRATRREHSGRGRRSEHRSMRGHCAANRPAARREGLAPLHASQTLPPPFPSNQIRTACARARETDESSSAREREADGSSPRGTCRRCRCTARREPRAARPRARRTGNPSRSRIRRATPPSSARRKEASKELVAGRCRRYRRIRGAQGESAASNPCTARIASAARAGSRGESEGGRQRASQARSSRPARRAYAALAQRARGRRRTERSPARRSQGRRRARAAAS